MRLMMGEGPFEERSFQLQHIRAEQGQLCRELFEQTFVEATYEGQKPVRIRKREPT